MFLSELVTVLKGCMMLCGGGGGDIVQWYPTVAYALSDYNNIL